MNSIIKMFGGHTKEELLEYREKEFSLIEALGIEKYINSNLSNFYGFMSEHKNTGLLANKSKLENITGKNLKGINFIYHKNINKNEIIENLSNIAKEEEKKILYITTDPTNVFYDSIKALSINELSNHSLLVTHKELVVALRKDINENELTVARRVQIFLASAIEQDFVIVLDDIWKHNTILQSSIFTDFSLNFLNSMEANVIFLNSSIDKIIMKNISINGLLELNSLIIANTELSEKHDKLKDNVIGQYLLQNNLPAIIKEIKNNYYFIFNKYSYNGIALNISNNELKLEVHQKIEYKKNKKD